MALHPGSWKGYPSNGHEPIVWFARFDHLEEKVGKGPYFAPNWKSQLSVW
jgi:hypothetical protein